MRGIVLFALLTGAAVLIWFHPELIRPLFNFIRDIVSRWQQGLA